MKRGQYPAAAEVAHMLAKCRASWLPTYFPNGVLRKDEGMFYLGSAEGEAGRSLPVPLRSTKPWLVDFSGDFAGDDLALLTRAIGKGADMKAGYAEALAFLGIGKATPIATKAEREFERVPVHGFETLPCAYAAIGIGPI